MVLEAWPFFWFHTYAPPLLSALFAVTAFKVSIVVLLFPPAQPVTAYTLSTPLFPAVSVLFLFPLFKFTLFIFISTLYNPYLLKLR